MNVINQTIQPRFVLYHADTVEVARGMPDKSIDFSVFSPPFASLYTYSNSPRDMGNVSGHEEFFEHYAFLIAETMRVMKPGRLVAIHCMQMQTLKGRDGHIGVYDFRGDIIRAYQAKGFIYHSEVCIWKDPVVAMQRTHALGLLHATIKKDSSMSRQGLADYLVIMRTPGDNEVPIGHTGESFPVLRWQRYASPVWAYLSNDPCKDPLTLRDGLEDVERPNPHYEADEFLVCSAEETSDESSGINPGNTLQHRSAREHDDERHICPLQLSVIRRAVRLWSNPDDVVWSPFAGIGSEGYVALQEGRRFIGAELKKSYYEQASRNLLEAQNTNQGKLFG